MIWSRQRYNQTTGGQGRLNHSTAKIQIYQTLVLYTRIAWLTDHISADNFAISNATAQVLSVATAD
jgi:hypothetical protein